MVTRGFVCFGHTRMMDDMQLGTDPMMHLNHSDAFGQRLCDGFNMENKRGNKEG